MPTEILRPNGAGDATEWTPSADDNWECVDEAVADDNLSYVSSAPPGEPHQDLYNLPDPSSLTASDTIKSIEVTFSGRRFGVGGSVTTACCIKENGVLTVGTQQDGGVGNYVERTQTWTTRPSDSGAWTFADIQALQIGIKDNDRDQDQMNVTQVFVTVDYTLAGGWVMVIHPS